MGETFSKSEGKVYVGDVLDFKVGTDTWCVAEIISVDEFGLTVLSHSKVQGQRGKVCHLDFRDTVQKDRVRPAGTFTGNIGLTAANVRATTIVATPHQHQHQHQPNVATFSPETQEQPTATTTLSQQRLFNKYSVHMHVDYCDKNQQWMCAKINSIRLATTTINAVTITVHVLGDSSYTDRTFTVTENKAHSKLAPFATKALC